jgi:hypothetical protein
MDSTQLMLSLTRKRVVGDRTQIRHNLPSAPPKRRRVRP